MFTFRVRVMARLLVFLSSCPTLLDARVGALHETLTGPDSPPQRDLEYKASVSSLLSSMHGLRRHAQPPTTDASAGVDKVSEGVLRQLPPGRLYDVAFPEAAALGLLLESDLTVVGFRSPRAERARVDGLERIRAPSTRSEGVEASRSLLPFSLAEFSGVEVGDMLVGMNGGALWDWPVQSVVRELAFMGGAQDRVLTFLRPLPAPGSRDAPPQAQTAAADTLSGSAYARFLQRVAGSLPKAASRVTGWSFNSATDFNVTVPVSEAAPLALAMTADLAGSVLARAPTLLSVDPMEVAHAALHPGSIVMRLWSPEHAVQVLLRRGPLAGAAWPGDALLAVDGAETAGAPLRDVLASLGVSPAHATAAAQDAARDGFALLGEQTPADEQALPLAELTLSDPGAGGDNGVLCIAAGRFCRLTVDPLADVTLVRTVAAALAARSAFSTEETGRSSITLTFRRATAVPSSLLATSRLGPLAIATARASGGSADDQLSPGTKAEAAEEGQTAAGASACAVPILCTDVRGRRRCTFRPTGTLRVQTFRERGRIVPASSKPDLAIAVTGEVVRSTEQVVGPGPFLAIPARFGGGITCGPVPFVSLGLRSGATGPESYACATLSPQSLASLRGAFVIVDRGGCTFPSKAFAIQDAGGLGMIVVNTGDEAPFSMAGGEEGKSVAIPVVMVDAAVGADMRVAVLFARERGDAPMLEIDAAEGACECAGPLSSAPAQPHADDGRIDPFLAAALRWGERLASAAEMDEGGPVVTEEQLLEGLERAAEAA
jgi:hypothetical protein